MQLAGFTSSQYPINLNFSSIGGIFPFELKFWGQKLGFEINGIPDSLFLNTQVEGL